MFCPIHPAPEAAEGNPDCSSRQLDSAVHVNSKTPLSPPTIHLCLPSFSGLSQGTSPALSCVLVFVQFFPASIDFAIESFSATKSVPSSSAAIHLIFPENSFSAVRTSTPSRSPPDHNPSAVA